MTAELNTKRAINDTVETKPLNAQKELRCRGCNNNNLSRIKRGPLVRTFLSWLPIKYYICYRCNRKTYRLESSVR
jgi:hypothetical protein